MNSLYTPLGRVSSLEVMFGLMRPLTQATRLRSKPRGTAELLWSEAAVRKEQYLLPLQLNWLGGQRGYHYTELVTRVVFPRQGLGDFNI